MLAQLLIAISIVFFAPPIPEPQELKELLPGLHIGEGIVEFVGTIAIDCHHPETPDVYLEMLVTAPDSREHESLVVASIKPSLLHAALLAAGFEPGKPVSRDKAGKAVPASGDRLRVLVAVIPDDDDDDDTGDETIEPDSFVPIESWVIHLDTEQSLADASSWTGLVFAGSIFVKNQYAADRAGTLISLTSFGDEVIAPTWMVSSQASIDEPVWIAQRELVPKQGTPVRVRIEAITKEAEPQTELHEPDGIDINRNP